MGVARKNFLWIWYVYVGRKKCYFDKSFEAARFCFYCG